MTAMVSLAQVSLNTPAAVDRNVIDEFRNYSPIADLMPWHFAAQPSGGPTFDYNYFRTTTTPNGDFREPGVDYVAEVAETEKLSTTCKFIGGKYTMDVAHVIAGDGSMVAFQTSQKVKGASAALNNAIINGTDADGGFDGLSEALTGSTTELNGGVTPDTIDFTDLSTAGAWATLGHVDTLMGTVDDEANVVLIGNKVIIGLIQQACRVVGYRTASEDAAGKVTQSYNGARLINAGVRPGSADPVVAITSHKTSLYCVRLGEDGFHGVAPAGIPFITTRLPNPDSDNVVVSGRVEIYASVVLKSTRAAAVLRNITVSA